MAENQLQLDNVWGRVNGNWKRVTPDELSEETIRAKSKTLWCRYCNKPVIKTREGANRPYFKHSRGDDDKVCPQRKILESQSVSEYHVKEKILPLRLQWENGIRLELGLLPIPENLRNSENKIQIKCPDNNRLDIFSERLHTDRIYWQDLGAPYLKNFKDPCPKYEIEWKYADMYHWPKSVNGIEYLAIFDGQTRRMLPPYSDIKIGKRYFYLTSANYLDLEFNFLKKDNGWNLYEFQVPRFDENVNRFFMDRDFWLNESPPTLYPIWPISVEREGIIQFESEKLYWFSPNDRDIKCRLFPGEEVPPQDKLLVTPANQTERQQMVSLGHYADKTLKYWYLSWQDIGYCRSEPPEVRVTTPKGEPVPRGTYTSLPAKKLKIEVPWDGKICVWKNGKKDWEHILKGNELFTLQIAMGERIEIFQGLDQVWEAEFKDPEAAKTSMETRETELLIRLRSCRGNPQTIPRAAGNLTNQLGKLTQLKKWLTHRIREGQIDEKAWKILKKEFEKE